MKKLYFLTCLITLLFFKVQAQQKAYYHTYKTTDSQIILTGWRVGFENKGKKYIKETADKLGRVTELKLIMNDSLYPDTYSCYDVAIIKFSYTDSTITQYNMINDSTYSSGIECGPPAKEIYYLKDNEIFKCRVFYDYKPYINDPDPKMRARMREEYQKNKNGIIEHYAFIYGYYFSSAKYEGFLPVSNRNISLDDYDLPYSKEATKSPFAIQNTPRMYEKNKRK